MSQTNNPLIESSVFKLGSNQNSDYLNLENGDFDFTELLSKNTAQGGLQSGNTGYLEKLNKNLETSNSINGDYFSAKNIGSTFSSIGAIGSALANVYGVRQQNKFNNEMLDMEKQRVAKENQRRDTQQSEYDKVWK